MYPPHSPGAERANTKKKNATSFVLFMQGNPRVAHLKVEGSHRQKSREIFLRLPSCSMQALFLKLMCQIFSTGSNPPKHYHRIFCLKMPVSYLSSKPSDRDYGMRGASCKVAGRVSILPRITTVGSSIHHVPVQGVVKPRTFIYAISKKLLCAWSECCRLICICVSSNLVEPNRS
jgi:hypothetical protein